MYPPTVNYASTSASASNSASKAALSVIPHLSAVCGTERYFITHPPGIVRLACPPNDGHKKSLYIILRLANKIKRFSAKYIEYFQNRITGVWVLPTRQNKRTGTKSETPIFAVCGNTGCACYSSKISYPQIPAAPEHRRSGAFLFLKTKNFLTGTHQTQKKCPL